MVVIKEIFTFMWDHDVQLKVASLVLYKYRLRYHVEGLHLGFLASYKVRLSSALYLILKFSTLDFWCLFCIYVWGYLLHYVLKSGYFLRIFNKTIVLLFRWINNIENVISPELSITYVPLHSSLSLDNREGSCRMSAGVNLWCTSSVRDQLSIEQQQDYSNLLGGPNLLVFDPWTTSRTFHRLYEQSSIRTFWLQKTPTLFLETTHPLFAHHT